VNHLIGPAPLANLGVAILFHFSDKPTTK